MHAFSALLVGQQEGHPACKNFCFKTPMDGSECKWVGLKKW